ncbi:hypothetical protein J4409_02700 [Candidatus Woesearchaeota archaeon]|nr:hypothetical protein [Candidatus Woesearchaeota archaeon]
MIKKLLKKTRGLLSRRNKRFAKAIARESLIEGEKLGRFAIKEIKREAPKAKRVLKKEAKIFSKKIKKIKR